MPSLSIAFKCAKDALAIILVAIENNAAQRKPFRFVLSGRMLQLK